MCFVGVSVLCWCVLYVGVSACYVGVSVRYVCALYVGVCYVGVCDMFV